MAFFRTGRLWKGLLALIAFYGLVAILTARPGDPALFPATEDGVTVYIINNGFHTDLVLPAEKVRARGGLLSQAGQAAEDKAWWVYGWGDAGFYTAKGFSTARVLDGFRALFAPGNPSVIRVFGVSRHPQEAFGGEVIPVRVSYAGFEALAKRMEASFVREGKMPVRTKVSDNTGAFFESREHFSILRLCNHWTADQLNAAGLPTTPMIDGLAPLFSLDLKWRAGVEAPAAIVREKKN